MLRFFSIPYSNPHVKSIFSQMNHLWTKYRNRMDIQLVAAELKIRKNSNISRNNFYKSIISQQDLLKAIATTISSKRGWVWMSGDVGADI